MVGNDEPVAHYLTPQTWQVC